MGKLVLFDFDRTLLNTDALKAEQALRIARITGLDDERVLEGMREYTATLPSKNDFTPQGFATYLHENYSVNILDVLKVYLAVPEYVSSFLYPNAISVISELTGHGHKVGIFSEAHREHQRKKVEGTGVLKYMNSEYVIIVPKKVLPEVVSAIPIGTIIVDDDKKVIEELYPYVPQIVPVWINRKSEEINPDVRTIFSLTEFLHLGLV